MAKGESFEIFCKSLLEAKGFNVEYTTRHTNEPDEGIDLIAYGDYSFMGPARYNRPARFAIQCKDDACVKSMCLKKHYKSL